MPTNFNPNDGADARRPGGGARRAAASLKLAKRAVNVAIWVSLPCLIGLSACGAVSSDEQASAGASATSTGGAGHSGQPGGSGGTGSEPPLEAGGAGYSGLGGSGGTDSEPPLGAGHSGQPGSGGAGSEPLLEESAGPFDLRRLTRREYENTVADLLPGVPGVPAVAATFPPDELSPTGYRAPNAYSAQQVELLLLASETVAESALQAGLLPAACNDSTDAVAGAVCARDFIQTFGHRVFRRPVTAEEADDLMTLFLAAADLEFTFSEALAQLVSAMLQTGSFLYHLERGDEPLLRDGELVALTPHQVASRLSYLLWETMPDSALMNAADMGALSEPEQVAAQAERLLQDTARSQRALRTFHAQWLSVEGLGELEKDPASYPEFTPAVAQALDQELSAFVAAAFADRGTLSTLLTAPYTYVNQATATLYDVAAASDQLERVELDPERRAGLLTGAPFLASSAYANATDPIRRGELVFRRLLCGEVPTHPGSDGVSALPVGDDLTMRERLASFNTQPVCAPCHQLLDPLGLAFENYDAVGAYRNTDNGKSIDASGLVRTPGGTELSFANAVELTQLLSKSDEVKACATRQWFRYALGRMESPADSGSMQRANLAGAANPDYSLRDMLTTLVQTKTFRFRALADDER